MDWLRLTRAGAPAILNSDSESNTHSHIAVPTVKSNSPSSSRATRRRERTRAAILAAARRLCAEGGAGNLTVADIAEAADVGVGTFYYHFATKDDVLVALMEEFMGRVAEAIAERRAVATDPIDRLRKGYAVCLDVSREEQELWRVYYGSAAARASFAEVARQFFFNDAMDTIRAGQDAGLFRAGNTELLANWLLGATSEALQWIMSQPDPPEPAMADTLAELSLTGLRGRDTAAS